MQEAAQIKKVADAADVARILVLHVKRFSYTETRREKLDTLVTFSA